MTQAYCIPSYTGAPYHTGTTLDWWGANLDPATNPTKADKLRSYPDDPDWLQAFSLSHGDGGAPHVVFRALSGTYQQKTYIHLSWVVLVDVTLSSGQLSGDGVDILLANGQNGIIFRLRLPQTTTTESLVQKRIVPNIQTKPYVNGAEGNALSSDPSYASLTARSWISYQSPSSTRQVKWAIQIAVPVGQFPDAQDHMVDTNLFDGIVGSNPPAPVNLPVGTPFKFWYNVHSISFSDSQNISHTAMYSWPQPNNHPTGSNTLPAGLIPADLVVQPNNTIVCEPGVTLAKSQMKVWDATGTTDRNYEIAVDLEKNASGQYVNNPPRHDPPKYQNLFTAAPSIPMAMQPSAGNIRGRFRLANWGSQSGVITDDSWKTVPNGEEIAYTVANSRLELSWPRQTFANTYEANFFNDLVAGIRVWKDWSDTPPATRPPQPPSNARDPHECWLVQLFSSDPNIIFTKDSEFVNSRFVQASTVQESAEISVVGLTPINQQPRDVYLYLQTANMPKVTDEVGTRATATARIKEGLFALQDASRVISYEDIMEWAPTYQIHAWHDTGLITRRTDGTEARILEPQTSFGYFAIHEGDVYGWETRLYGAEKLAENFYSLRVPNNGSIRVTAAIQARELAAEKPLPPDGNPGCCGALATWLDTKGPIGKILAVMVRFFCKLLGQLTT